MSPAKKPLGFKGVVRLTRLGAAYLIITLTLGFAALNTGNNSLYIGLSFMLGVLLFSGISSKGGLKHLRTTISARDEIWAGTSTEVEVVVGNDSPLWSVRDLLINTESMERPAYVSMIERKSEMTISASFVFPRRGRITIPFVDLYTRYPLGLFLKKRRVKAPVTIIVFPRLLSDDPDNSDSGELGAGAQPWADLGSGSEPFAFRDYVRGDSLRLVHWKKSARIGRWIIKQTERESAYAVHIVIDPAIPEGANDDEFELMISRAATVVYRALGEGAQVTLDVPAGRVVANGNSGRNAIFESLALVEGRVSHRPQRQLAGTLLFSLFKSPVHRPVDDSRFAMQR